MSICSIYRKAGCKRSVASSIAAALLLALLIIAGAMAMPAKVHAADSGYLRFTSDEAFTLQFNEKNWEGTVEYSTDANTWTEYASAGTDIHSAELGGQHTLYVRGTDNNTFGRTSDSGPAVISINATAGSLVRCDGSIESLLDYETVLKGDHPYMKAYAFNRMFKDCKSLQTAPSLPATQMMDSCYRRMFDGCTSLEAAPVLLATRVEKYSYSLMFNGCTSLKAAPALPATWVEDFSYQGMFAGCTSLKTAPALPATRVEKGSYSTMFQGCTSLTSSPKLPATRLADTCYEKMFFGCTSLKAAPALPATQLAAGCYLGMFWDCTSLVRAPVLPANQLTKQCYKWMFANCKSLVAPPALPAVELADYCYDGMFDGCKSLETSPELPAGQLANYCYRNMFAGCTSLKAAPALPAVKLTNCCYYQMFKNCTSLKLSSDEGTYGGVDYTVPYRIPSENNYTSVGTDSIKDMFVGTGGVWTGKPELNHIYYMPDVPECAHEQTSHVPAKDATCTEEGNVEYWYCDHCYRCFSDEAATQEITEITIDIDPSTHVWGEWTRTKEPTCTKKGTFERFCEREATHKETVYIDALGHSFTDYHPNNDVTCTKGGTETAKCDRCEETDTREREALGHDWNIKWEWTGNELNGYTEARIRYNCKRCTSARSWIVTEPEITVVEPTCTEYGKTVYKLTKSAETAPDGIERSDTKEALFVEPLGHDYHFTGWTWTGDEESGYTGAVANYTCGREGCGDTQQCSAELTSRVIDPTCAEGGKTVYTASVLGVDAYDGENRSDTKEAKFTDPLPHTYEDVADSAIKATCTKPGKEADRVCSVCGDLSQGETIDALGHTWGEWETLTPATEDQEGKEKATCSVCGVEETRVIPVLNHTHQRSHVEAKAATCKDPGNIEYWVCDQGEYPCGAYFSADDDDAIICEEDTVRPKTGMHQAGEPREENVTEPTCNRNGEFDKVYYCTVCGDKISSTHWAKPQLEHVPGAPAVENLVAATCTSNGSYDVVTRCTKCNTPTDITSCVIPELEHEWQEATCVEPKKCTKCGITEGRTLVHDWEDATCTAPKRCSYCGATEGEALGHDWGTWTVSKKATATAAGQRKSTCKRCFEEGTKAIAKNNMTAKAKSKILSAKAKKKTTIKATKAFKVTGAKGKVKYKKSSGDKKITVAKNGKITVKKGLKKNKTYTVKVKVTSAATAEYETVTKTVTLKIKIK